MIGETVASRYRVLRLIGTGGMGEVFEAQDHERRERVALKILHPRIRDPTQIKRFLREAKVAAALESHHTVRLLDSGVDPGSGRHFISTELLQGDDLAALMGPDGLSEELVTRIAVQCCEGLGHAHQAGIVHRDIKPKNIFVANDGSLRIVKIVDFGIAKLQPRASGLGSSRLTETGSLLGSPSYMAPEQAAGERSIDARADVWSLGVVMFEALTGNTPHGAETVGELLLEICGTPAPPIRDVAPHVSEALAAVIDRALRLDREERYESARELGAALRELLPGDATITEALLTTERDTASPTSRNRAPLVLAVCLVAALAIYYAFR